MTYLMRRLEVRVRIFGDRLSSSQIPTASETRRYSVKELWKAFFFELLARPTPDEHDALANTGTIALRLRV
jgi:hypothetical protein